MSDVELSTGVTESLAIPIAPKLTKPAVKKRAPVGLRVRKAAPLTRACTEGAEVIGEAEAGTWLLAHGRCGPFYQVEHEGRLAFVDARSVKEGRGSKPGKGGGVHWSGHHGAPKIELVKSVLDELEADSPELLLEGVVLDDGQVRDVSIYVYTRHGRQTRPRKIAYVSHGQEGPLRIHQRVKLHEGLNRIVVLARDDDDLTGSASMRIHRRRAIVSKVAQPPGQPRSP